MKPTVSFLLFLALSLGGCGPSTDSVPQGSSGSETASEATPTPRVRGQAVYVQYCVVCHQADGSGKTAGTDSAMAAGFSGADSVLNKPDEELLRSIKVGRSGAIGVMPKWLGILDKQQRRDVLTYIRLTFASSAPSSRALKEAPEGTSPEGS